MAININAIRGRLNKTTKHAKEELIHLWKPTPGKTHSQNRSLPIRQG